MAVVEIHEDGSLEHHRNPSGLNNKVRYLLCRSKRDLNELRRIFKYGICYKNCKIGDWFKAFRLARYSIENNISKLCYIDIQKITKNGFKNPS